MARVLVTRPEPDAGRTAETLARRGHVAVVDPMLKIIVEQPPTLDLFGVAAVATTSSNSLRALDRIDPVVLGRLPLFAVGDATADLARAAGFRDVRSADGAADDLARLIARDLDPARGTILWLTGQERAVDLGALLAGHGFGVRMIEVYRTEPARTLAPETRRALREGTLDVVTVYSARTGEAYLAAAADADLTREASEVPVVAISAKAGEALRAAGFDVRLAADPSGTAMLSAIEAVAPTDPPGDVTPPC